MLPMLEYFRHMFGNYGWAIIMVTLVIKFILLPLSIKQTQSSQKMQTQMAKLKPEIERIQEKYNQRKKKYESDPEKLEEVHKEFQGQMSDLYKTKGMVNPLGGCLPTLLQFPILIALYWSFSGPPFQPSIAYMNLQATSEASTKDKSQIKFVKSNTSNFVDSNGKLNRISIETNIPEKLLVGESYELKLKSVLGKGEIPKEEIQWHLMAKGQNPSVPIKQVDKSNWSNGLIDFQIDSSDKSKATIKALKSTEKFSLQAAIPEARGHQRFLFIEDLGRLGLYNKETKDIHWDIIVLVILMGASFWASNKLMMGSTPTQPSLDKEQEAMQKQMQNLMPIMFLGMMAFLPIPAGVFLYFIVSNVIQLLQSLVMQKFPPKDDEINKISNHENKLKVVV
jgi:YidC/Oxa1 family membrane protein insertase